MKTSAEVNKCQGSHNSMYSARLESGKYYVDGPELGARQNEHVKRFFRYQNWLAWKQRRFMAMAEWCKRWEAEL